jgi:hypothetical protein
MSFKKNLMFLGLTTFIFMPSLRVFFKYTGEYAIALSIIYFLLIIILYYQMIYNRIFFLNVILSKKMFIFVLSFIVLIVVWNIYPIADGLKDQMRGSDQDDCVILGVEHLLNFENPYQSKSYYGNPCSPGFGVFIPYIPLVYLNVYSLGAPFFIFFLTYFIYKIKSENTLLASTFLVIILSCILLLELMVVGSDLIYIGVGIALLSIMLTMTLESKNIKLLLLTSLLAGIIASTRVNFLIIIFIASSYVFLHWRVRTFLFLFLSLLIALIPSSIIWFFNPETFTPLHLLGKSSILMPPMLKYFAIIFSIVFFLWSLYKVNESIRYINFGFFISLSPSLLGVSLGDLFIARSGDIAMWEGANYLIPLVPLAGLILIELKKIDESKLHISLI